MGGCATAKEMTQRLARCMLSKTRSRIDFSPDWSLLVELHKAMDIITLQLEPTDNNLSHRSAVFVDEVIAIAQTARSSFFTALGDAPDGPAPDIHITPLVLHSQGGSVDAADLRTISFVKVSRTPPVLPHFWLSSPKSLACHLFTTIAVCSPPTAASVAPRLYFLRRLPRGLWLAAAQPASPQSRH